MLESRSRPLLKEIPLLLQLSGLLVQQDHQGVVVPRLVALIGPVDVGKDGCLGIGQNLHTPLNLVEVDLNRAASAGIVCSPFNATSAILALEAGCTFSALWTFPAPPRQRQLLSLVWSRITV